MNKELVDLLNRKLSQEEEQQIYLKIEQDDALYEELQLLIEEREKEKGIKAFWSNWDSNEKDIAPIVQMIPQIAYAPLERAASTTTESTKWVSSPNAYQLSENFALQTSHSEDNKKILLQIYSVKKSTAKLPDVVVTFTLETVVEVDENKRRKTLKASAADPSYGELQFDLSDITYIKDRNITIHLECMLFQTTLVHRLDSIPGEYQ